MWVLRVAFHCKTIPLALRLSAAAVLRLTEAIAASLRSAENKTKPSGGRRRFKTPFHSTNDLRCILAGGDFNTKKGALKAQKTQMRILFLQQKPWCALGRRMPAITYFSGADGDETSRDASRRSVSQLQWPRWTCAAMHIHQSINASLRHPGHK